MESKPRAAPLVILYDRMTPEAQQRLIDRFVQQDLDRLVKLTALRSAVGRLCAIDDLSPSIPRPEIDPSSP